jgi:hypothetical protein
MRRLFVPAALSACLLVPVAATAAAQDPTPTPTPPVTAPAPPVVANPIAPTPPVTTPIVPPTVTATPTPTPPTLVPTPPIVLPTPLPLPVVNRVVDVPTANAFTRAFAARNAARFLRTTRDRVRVTDVNSTCLRSPVSSGNFGCVFALQAAVVARNNHRWDWDTLTPARIARAATHSPVPPTPPSPLRVRIERFGCLGEIDIAGGPTVQPIASVDFLDCARIPNTVTNVPIPTPYVAPTHR